MEKEEKARAFPTLLFSAMLIPRRLSRIPSAVIQCQTTDTVCDIYIKPLCVQGEDVGGLFPGCRSVCVTQSSPSSNEC